MGQAATTEGEIMSDHAQAELEVDGAPAAKRARRQVEEAPAVAMKPPIPANNFGLKEHNNPGYWICLPAGYTVEHLKQAHMWANIAGTGNLRGYSTVEVFTADHTWFALVYIFDCGRNWARTQVLQHFRLEAADRPAQMSRFSVVHRGPVDQYCVVELNSNTTVKTGLTTELDALRFKTEHERKIA
jgi:hypothetical protein